MRTDFNGRERELANTIDSILRRAYSDMDCGEWHTHVAAALKIGYSTLCNYLNGSSPVPALILAPLVRLLREEAGVCYADALLCAVLGPGWDIQPHEITPDDERDLGNLPALMSRAGETFKSVGDAHADGVITPIEAREAHRLIRQLLLALEATDRRMAREAKGGAL